WRITRSAKESLPILIRALRGCPTWLNDEYVQERAARILGAIGPRAKPAVPALCTALRDENPRVRVAPAEALWKVTGGVEKSVPILTQVLANGWEGSSDAAAVLGQMGSDAKEAVPHLSHALRDGDSSVRLAAAQALGCLGPEARTAAPALIKSLKDDCWL